MPYNDPTARVLELERVLESILEYFDDDEVEVEDREGTLMVARVSPALAEEVERAKTVLFEGGAEAGILHEEED